MWRRRCGRSSHGGGGELASSLAVLLCSALLLAGGAAAQRSPASSPWKTLSGNPPIVIAKGGFSGVFPDSSESAFRFAQLASAPDTSLWCDLQLTKDGVGICLRDVNLQNCTDINQVYPQGKAKYLIDGELKTGWFSVDYNMTALQSVILTQAIWSRTERLDNSMFPILALTDVQSLTKTSPLWVNVQHDIFYRQHGLNMTRYVLSLQKPATVKYISSPEVAFLQSISGRVSRNTKLVFRFPDRPFDDPSTNKTYSSLLSNLTFIKAFASGIMVPKNYIWPVAPDNYLDPAPTSIVTDAHKAGLEIYASDFANDRIICYNYSYDPLAEYLSFIDDGGFSVDGVLTDYPLTASEAIGCFTNLNRSKTDHGKPLVISHNGASGDYPDCTDLAYKKAVDDGADIIDCSVQMTSDGVPVCMGSIDLLDDTNVQSTIFSTRGSVIPKIKSGTGIFTFNVSWDDINSPNNNLKPKISSPQSQFTLVRNPRYRNRGQFLKLSEFLAFAKDNDLYGVLINIEHAPFMAGQLGFDVVGTVISALADAGYNNQSAQKVMIQSPDSSVLIKFKQETKYQLVYTLPDGISDASPTLLAEVKKFADTVAVERSTVFALNRHFIVRQTNLVKDLQSAGLAVYVYLFQNEFVSPPWDFFSDGTAEINTYVQAVNIDGIITDFPLTARRYKRNSCRNMGNNTPNYMDPIEVGGLLQAIQPNARPPAIAPMPALNRSTVEEPLLPPVNAKAPAAGAGSAPAPASPRSTGPKTRASLSVPGLMIGVALLI